MRQAVCADCRQPILWTRTEAGKALAVDPVPHPEGNAAVRRDGTGAWLSRRPNDELPLCGYERLHKPHIATCPSRQTVIPLPAGVTRLSDHRKTRRNQR